jgi:hypothetical protein
MRRTLCLMMARTFCELSGRVEGVGRRLSDRLGSVADWFAELGSVEDLD